MKKILTTLVVLTSLWTAALAEDSPRLLTVNVDNAPAQTEQVRVSLDGTTQVELKLKDADSWSGEFLLLPSLYKGAGSPVVELIGPDGSSLPPSNLKKSMTSSTLSPETVSQVVRSGNTAFVLDGKASHEVVLLTWHGQEIFPRMSGDSFTLPEGTSPDSIATVVGRFADGETVVFEADWDVDLADAGPDGQDY